MKVFEIWGCGGQTGLPSVSPRKDFTAHYKKPMAKVFGILTAIVLALSALVFFKNKEEFESRTAATQNEKDLLTKSQARLKAAKEVLEALPIEIAAVGAEVEKLTAAEAAQQKANDATKAEIDAISTKLAANKEKLDGIREKTSKIGDLKELSSKMRTTSSELEELDQSITACEAKLSNLTAQDSSLKAEVGGAKVKVDTFASGQSLSSMKTRIRSIYPNWGFVTLASGNNAGVMANSTLNVVRDGETIAKLLVTAVETGSSSASIVPDSLASDVTLQVGDYVIPGQATAKANRN